MLISILASACRNKNTENKEENSIKELLIYLEKLQYDKTKNKINREDLQKYYGFLYKIDFNYKLDEKSHGADQGRDILFGVIYNYNNSHKIVLIGETGYWRRKNTEEML